MGNKRGILSAVLVTVAIVLAGSISAQGIDPRPGVDRGLELFSRGDYAGALPLFRMAASADARSSARSAAQYWSILSRMALGETASLLPEIERFRTDNRDSPYLPDLIYQRGRIQFYAGDFMAAYESFKWFINEPLGKHPLRSSAVFWLGECLLAMDKPALARTVYQTIVKEYPSSVKYEAAVYRLETMSQMSRERILMDELDRTRISASLSRLEYARAVREYESTILGLRNQIAELNAKLSLYQEKQAVLAETAPGSSVPLGGSSLIVIQRNPTVAGGTAPGTQARISDLLAAKAETLDLLEKYIRQMKSEGNK